MAGVKGRSGGRNAKSVEEHKLTGTFRPHRHGGIENPDPPQGIPEPPKVLTGEAADEWARMIRRLEHARTLSIVDGAALYQLCMLHAETEAIAATQEETAASIDILEDNLSDIPKDQLVQVFQEITKLRQLEARYTSQIQSGRMKVRAYLVEFGLTPAARSRVKVISAPKETAPASPLAQLHATRGLRAIK